ncbi:unnamed protein product, partial [Brassica oleracea var. botrytis]
EAEAKSLWGTCLLKFCPKCALDISFDDLWTHCISISQTA